MTVHACYRPRPRPVGPPAVAAWLRHLRTNLRTHLRVAAWAALAGAALAVLQR